MRLRTENLTVSYGAQTVLDAAQAMKRHRAKSILVRAGERVMKIDEILRRLESHR